MAVSSPRRTLKTMTGTVGSGPVRPLAVVVGYDGSEPARHALDLAADLLRDREGTLEVVYVTHLTAGAALSGEGVTEILRAQDELAALLAEEVRHRLVGEDHPWQFQRRDGRVGAELMAVATDLHGRYGDTAEVVIVVGGSAQRYHRLAGSVGSSVVRSDRFPVMVVP